MRLKFILYLFLITFLNSFSQNEKSGDSIVINNHSNAAFDYYSDESLDFPLTIKFGINLVDSSGDLAPFDWLKNNREFPKNTQGYAFNNPYKIAAEYRFSEIFAAGIDLSINKWEAFKGVIDNGLISQDYNYFAVDVKAKMYLFDALDFFNEQNWMDIYIEGGLGYFTVLDGAMSANVAFGGNLWITKRVGVFLEGAGKWSLQNKRFDSNHFQYSAGIAIRLGKEEKPIPIPEIIKEPEPVVINIDTDGDGITDEFDECPEIPGVVENKGCPKKEEPEVVLNVNEEDKAKIFNLSKFIFFEIGKSTLKPESLTALNQVIDILRAYPGVNIHIVGHTDSTGSASSNDVLSDSRANAVRVYLVNNGLSSYPITSEGRGESDPIASNLTVEGRSKNRRVEIIVKDDLEVKEDIENDRN